MSAICWYVDDAHSERGMLGSELSDMWKEAFCSRPRHFNFRTMTTLELRHEIASLMPAHSVAMDEYEEREKEWLIQSMANANNSDVELTPIDEVFASQVSHEEIAGTRVWTF